MKASEFDKRFDDILPHNDTGRDFRIDRKAIFVRSIIQDIHDMEAFQFILPIDILGPIGLGLRNEFVPVTINDGSGWTGLGTGRFQTVSHPVKT